MLYLFRSLSFPSFSIPVLLSSNIRLPFESRINSVTNNKHLFSCTSIMLNRQKICSSFLFARNKIFSFACSLCACFFPSYFSLSNERVAHISLIFSFCICFCVCIAVERPTRFRSLSSFLFLFIYLGRPHSLSFFLSCIEVLSIALCIQFTCTTRTIPIQQHPSKYCSWF